MRSTTFAVLFLAGPALAQPPAEIAPYFAPPKEFAAAFGDYRNPLLFNDGSKVTDAAGWAKRRAEILATWTDLMGEWPAVIDAPKAEWLTPVKKDGYTRFAAKIEVAPGRVSDDAILLVPDGKGPFPAVVVVFYDAKTGAGEGKEPERDFARQLAKRGFVALSFGSAPESYYPDKTAKLQPLSYHAYEAANLRNALARRADVDPNRIGVMGHSYGGKWAMFAGALNEKFAAAAWSDPGIVFDEKRSNVNYWERWYLGHEVGNARKPGTPNDANPRTGPYKLMVEKGHDLHEIHALMAPRPFLVSGGSEDPAERWKALNHSVAVNALLGQKFGVAMTTRPKHDPTPESNAVLVRFFEWALRK